MKGIIATTNHHIRTVLHLTPAVTTAALMQAQTHDLQLGEWLENLIVQSCGATAEANAAGRLSDLMTMELFAHIGSNCPGALTGRWKLLFERCLQEPSLWRYPLVTLAEAEAGADSQPTLDLNRLAHCWPELVASVWLL